MASAAARPSAGIWLISAMRARCIASVSMLGDIALPFLDGAPERAHPFRFFRLKVIELRQAAEYDQLGRLEEPGGLVAKLLPQYNGFPDAGHVRAGARCFLPGAC